LNKQRDGHPSLCAADTPRLVRRNSLPEKVGSFASFLQGAAECVRYERNMHVIALDNSVT
jgi:hypothetical protein